MFIQLYDLLLEEEELFVTEVDRVAQKAKALSELRYRQPLVTHYYSEIEEGALEKIHLSHFAVAVDLPKEEDSAWQLNNQFKNGQTKVNSDLCVKRSVSPALPKDKFAYQTDVQFARIKGEAAKSAFDKTLPA